MISIILPIRNEARYIAQCLQAIFEQDYPQDQIEILVVDGMSTDGTRQIILDLQQKVHNLILIDNPAAIVSNGMNLALRLAKGEIIIRVDGHCVIARDYISKCVNYLKNNEIAGVGGPMETIGETPTSRIIALAMSSQFGVGNSAFRTLRQKSLFVDTIPFPAYTKKVIELAGFYDEELVRNQDDEYNYRIRKMGGKLLLAKDISSKYYSRGSLKKLWRQFFQYGYYKVRVLQKHPGQMSPRQFVPFLLIIGLSVSLLLSFLISWGWITFAVIAGGYFSAVLIASALSTRKIENYQNGLLPLAFTIIHLSYGTGFLCGLFRFWNRWGDKIGNTPEK